MSRLANCSDACLMKSFKEANNAGENWRNGFLFGTSNGLMCRRKSRHAYPRPTTFNGREKTSKDKARGSESAQAASCMVIPVTQLEP